MPAPSYTTCVDRKVYKDPKFPSGDFFASLAAVIAQGGFDLLLRICDYVLHGKLVCLGGDRCAIGYVASFETVDDKSGFDKLDNDFSINLALCPGPLSGLQAGSDHRIDNYNLALANKQGWLIKEEENMPKPREGEGDNKYAGTFVKIHTILSLDNPIPEKIANESDAETWHLPVLHTEIEGDRAAYVCAVADAFWGPLHKTVCKIPWIGGFVCTIITILTLPFLAAVMALLAAAWAAGSNDNRDFDGGGDLKADDLVLIRGRWVYDAGHGGWNELHPVKHIQKIPDQAVNNWTSFDDFYKRWCGEVAKTAHAPATMGAPPKDATSEQKATWEAQIQPENRWLFHPLVDGCTPDERAATVA